MVYEIWSVKVYGKLEDKIWRFISYVAGVRQCFENI